MTYDLRRLRLKGRYLRILRPEWNALLPEHDQRPRSFRTALEQLETEIQKLYEEAALAA
jgi:hypothetical protein